MLFGTDIANLYDIALVQIRQPAFPLFLALRLGFLVNLQKAGEGDHRTIGTESGIRTAVEFNLHHVNQRRLHLAGHGALPDEFVQAELVL